MASTILINLIFTAIISLIAYFKYLSAKKDIYKSFAIGFALFSIPYLFTVLRISFYGRSEVDLIISIIGYIAIIYGVMAATPANQTLRINAVTTIDDDLYVGIGY